MRFPTFPLHTALLGLLIARRRSTTFALIGAGLVVLAGALWLASGAAGRIVEGQTLWNLFYGHQERSEGLLGNRTNDPGQVEGRYCCRHPSGGEEEG